MLQSKMSNTVHIFIVQFVNIQEQDVFVIHQAKLRIVTPENLIQPVNMTGL